MKPILLVLVGLPGSGKTTLADWLAANSEVVVVSRDTIRAAMFPSCRYTVAEKTAAFDAMRAAITITLGQGKRVCTDGMTFASTTDRDAILAVADRAGADVRLLWCDVPVPVAQARVEQDLRTVFPDRDAHLVVDVSERFEPLPDDAHRLDMTRPVEEIGKIVLETMGW